MKKRTKLLLLVLIIVLIGLILQSSYSKYVAKTKSLINKKVAPWLIYVNDSDIVTGETFTFSPKFSIFNNENVYPGNIAPGSSGFFLIAIDATKTKVSVQYDLDIDLTDFNRYVGQATLGISGIRKANFSDNGNYLSDGPAVGFTNTGTNIKVSDVKHVNNGELNNVFGYKIEVTWTNDDAHNEANNALARRGVTIHLPMTLHVKQYTGM